ncbi:hypothetical protein AVEN_93767-1 [Araneus ventricosus]|uniref:Uncharacterized protein n=1 Tax=Araneus ventricosus TaxID=182803 RepID=A0A4Y2FU67_ARAVE|nr:hypothetical protein AVEN_93767-1 [Araneus ventricosus]
MELIKIAWNGSPVSKPIEIQPVIAINNSLIVISFKEMMPQKMRTRAMKVARRQTTIGPRNRASPSYSPNPLMSIILCDIRCHMNLQSLVNRTNKKLKSKGNFVFLSEECQRGDVTKFPRRFFAEASMNQTLYFSGPACDKSQNPIGGREEFSPHMCSAGLDGDTTG